MSTTHTLVLNCSMSGPGCYTSEVSWSLSCPSHNLSLSGVSPHSSIESIPKASGTCTLDMFDSYGDGWTGNAFRGLGQILYLSSGSSGHVTFDFDNTESAPAEKIPTCENFCGEGPDNDCDDGGPGSEFSSCELGSDCQDCGDRTTIPSPPSLPPAPSAPPCYAVIDLVLVVDASGSMSGFEEDFKTFLSRFITDLNMGEDAARVGIVQFGTTVTNLADISSNKNYILNAINSYHVTGSSYPEAALQTAVSMLQMAGNVRPNGQIATQVIFFILDGQQTNLPPNFNFGGDDSLVSYAATVHDQYPNIIIFANGIYSAVPATIEAVASHSKYAFMSTFIEGLTTQFIDTHFCGRFLPPPSPPSSPPPSADVAGDPHLYFAGGRKADFRGVPRMRFSLLSAPGFAANVHIDAADFMVFDTIIHGTYMTELTMRCGEAYMSHNATNASKWGFGWQSTQLRCSDRDAVQYIHPHNTRKCSGKGAAAMKMLVVMKYATASFQCGNWTVMSTVQPVARYVSGASRNLDIRITGPSKGAHGLVGQNMDVASARDGALDKYPYKGEYTTVAQAEGAIDGAYMDYAVPSAYSTNFKYSRFDSEGDGGEVSTVEAISTKEWSEREEA